MTTRSQTFAHNGKTYKVQAELLGDVWRVGVFDGDRPFGGSSTVSTKTVEEEMASGTADPLKAVMDRAQDDFLRAAREQL